MSSLETILVNLLYQIIPHLIICSSRAMTQSHHHVFKRMTCGGDEDPFVDHDSETNKDDEPPLLLQQPLSSWSIISSHHVLIMACHKYPSRDDLKQLSFSFTTIIVIIEYHDVDGDDVVIALFREERCNFRKSIEVIIFMMILFWSVSLSPSPV